MDGGNNLSEFFQEPDFFDAGNFSSVSGAFPPDDLFAVLQAWETTAANSADCNNTNNNNNNNPAVKTLEKTSSSDAAATSKDMFEFQKSSCVFPDKSGDQPMCTKHKMNPSSTATAYASASSMEEGSVQPRMSHITVERNRRKQMNEHLSVLRSLMPCFYVKRGDQASIIGGVVDYIHELQQILHSLEAKKKRKAYAEVISPSPRPVSSPLSPRIPPLSPRMNLSISPRTPQPSSPYKPWMRSGGFHLTSPTQQSPVVELQPSPGHSSTNSSINDAVVNELVATSKTAMAEVEVKFSGPNLVLKTVSHRNPGQAVKIVSALEELALEILQMKISIVDETMLIFFTIKIGIDCQLSAEELAQQIQQTFCL